MKKYTFLLVLFVLGTLSINIFAQKNKPSNTDTKVTSNFQDVDLSTGLYYTMRSDSGSDSGADYVNGTNGVASAIQAIGDWDFDLSISPNRMVFFDFSSVIAGTNENNVTPPDSGAYTVRALAQCSVRPGKRLQDLRIGDGSIYCPVNFRIMTASGEYSLRFRSVEFPGSNDAAWSCTSETAAGKCSGWRMESAPGGSIARLLKLTTAKGKTTTQTGSLFNFTFKVDLRIP